MPQREDYVPAEMPEGTNPEEFMNDAALVKHLQAKHESLEDGDEKKEVAQQIRRAKLAAAITAAVDPDATE